MNAFELAKKTGKFAEEKKGKDIVILELTGITDIADYFLIVSGKNERHVKTIAEHILHKMKTMGLNPYSTEGLENGRWVIIDCASLVTHVFLESLREFYDLENVWFEAKRLTMGAEKTRKGVRNG